MANHLDSASETNGTKRKNLATTDDGSLYNKRQRPDFIYNREPPTDVAHLGHPDLEDGDEKGLDGDKAEGSHRNMIFDSRKRDFRTQNGGLDPTYGQKYSLPIPSGEDHGSDSESNEVWKYMRAVRSEAAGIPKILRAQEDDPADHNEEEEDGEYTIKPLSNGDTGGYYEDGAYVAGTKRPYAHLQRNSKYSDDPYEDDDLASSHSTSSSNGPPPREAYTERLLTRFLAHRRLLRTPPPHGLVSSLTPSQPIWVPPSGSFLACKDILEGSDPVPAQVASMNDKSVMRLLYIAMRTLTPGANISRRASRWIWSLLARVPDAGGMSNDGVWDLRQQLGKRAVILRAVWDERARDIAQKRGLLDRSLEWYVPDENHARRGEQERIQGDRKHTVGTSKGSNRKHVEGERGEEASSDEQPMDLETASESSVPAAPPLDKLAAAKARLLLSLSTDGLTDPRAHAVHHEADDSDLEDGELTDGHTDGETKNEETSQYKDSEEGTAPDIRKDPTDFEPFPNLNTRVTLDTIITVIGHVYGQRDLLDCGEDWDAE